MKTKIICVVLSALLLLPLLGFRVYAEDTPTVEVKAFTREEWYSLDVSVQDVYFNYAIENNGGEAPSFSVSGKLGKGLSYEYYNGLLTNDHNVMLSLQMLGLVNFNLQIGDDDDGMSGGGFGGHRDDIDRSFDEFQEKYPYAGDGMMSNAYKFSNGYYITWEPLYIGRQTSFNLSDAKHVLYKYALRFYLHDETGKIISISSSSLPVPWSYYCDICNDIPIFDNFTIVDGGKYTVDCLSADSPHLPRQRFTSIAYDLPWYNLYGEPTEEERKYYPIPIVLTDDNGNTINATKEGDYITYEGNSYTYNSSDNSVNIGGNTYYYSYNYGNMNDDYLRQFFEYLINKLNENNGNDNKFDASSILAALQSIYDKLRDVITNIQLTGDTIANNLWGGFNNLSNKLDQILQQLKELNKEVKEQTKEEEEKNALAWLELINDFKKKVGWSALESSIENIKTVFFGDRVFTETEDGGVDVDIITEEQEVIKSKLPDLYITVPIAGKTYKYNLYDCVASLCGGIATIKLFISSFLWMGFIVSVFRSIPSILGGVSSLQDSSNSVTIHSGESKKGG